MKRRQVVKQRRRRAPQAERQTGDVRTAPFHPEGRFTYVTEGEAASYLRFDTAKDPARAFRQWASRQGVAVCKRGRVSLYLVADLDDAVRGPRDTRKQIQQAHGGRS